MRLVGDFRIREIMDEIVALPTGESMGKFSGIISLNPVGRFLMEALATEQTEESLVDAVLEEYDADRETVEQDVREFLEVLRKNGLIIES